MANEVSVTVTGQDQGARSTLTQAAQSGDQLSGSVKRVGETASGVLAANAFSGLASQVGQFLTQTVAAGDEIAITAQKMGLSTDALQEMRFWADQNGLSHQDLERAVGRLTQRVGRAEEGSSKYADALDRLGVEARDANGEIRPTEQILRDVIAALRDIEDPATRSAVASDLLGTKMARELMPALTDTSVSLDEAAARARDLGLVMDKDAIEASGRFAEATDELKQSSAAMLRDGLTPTIQFLADVALPVVGRVVEMFSALPDPIQGVVGTTAALSAGLLVLTPRLLAARTAMQQMGTASRTMALRGGGALAAVSALATAASFFEDKVARAEIPTQDLADDLVRLDRHGRATGEVLRVTGRDTGDFADTVREAGIEAEGLSGRLKDIFTNPFGSQNQITESAGQIEDLDAALAEIASSGGDASSAFRALVREEGLTAEQTQMLLELLPNYRREQERANERTRDAGDAATEAGGPLEDLAEQLGHTADDTESAAAKMRAAWQDTAKGFIDGSEAIQDAQADLRDDQELTTSQWLDELEKQREAQVNWHNNMLELMRQVPDELHQHLVEASAEELELLNSGTEKGLERWIDIMRSSGRTAGGDLMSEVQSNFAAGSSALRAIAEQEGEDVAREIAQGMRRRGSTVEREAQRVGFRIDRGVGGNRTISITPVVRQPVGVHRIQGIAGMFTAFESGGIVGGMAAGGVSGAGSQAQQGGPRGGADVLVGEDGPEIAQLPFGTRVVPSGQSQGMMDSGGGPVVVENVFRSDGTRVGDMLVELFRHAMRTEPRFRAEVAEAVSR